MINFVQLIISLNALAPASPKRMRTVLNEPSAAWFGHALVLVIMLGSFSEPGFVKTKINNNIVLLLPEEFQVMTAQDVTEKVVTPRQSIALYTNPERRVNFSINQSSTSWEDSDLDLMKDFYKSSLMSLFSEIEFIREDIEIIKGREFAVFEFISIVRDQRSSVSSTGRSVKRYNYIQYTLVDSKTIVFSFSAPAVERNRWSGPARTIMSSVKIK